MGDRGGGDDEGGGKKKGGKSSEGEPHEFEKKGAAVLQNRYILVTLKDGPDRDTPRRGRVTATGGTSAQIVWDGGGQEIIDLGQPDVVFVEESTKLRFEGGKLKKSDDDTGMDFVFDAGALPAVEGEDVNFGGYGGCKIKRVVNADTGEVLISVPGIGDRAAKRHEWNYRDAEKVRAKLKAVRVGALVVIKDEAWGRGVYDWAQNVPGAVRAVRKGPGGAERAVVRLPPAAAGGDDGG